MAGKGSFGSLCWTGPLDTGEDMNHAENAILFADGWYVLVNGEFVKA